MDNYNKLKKFASKLVKELMEFEYTYQQYDTHKTCFYCNKNTNQEHDKNCELIQLVEQAKKFNLI